MFKLARLAKDDFPLFAKLAFDPVVMNRNLGRVFTQEEAGWLFDAMVCANEKPTAITGWYRAALRETDEFIGLLGLSHRDEEHIEIEYMLLPQYWGKGFATRLVGEQLRIIRREAPQAAVTAITDPGNIASIRVLEKNGFQWIENFVNEDGENVSIYEF